eukprot:TRINITY_DN1759_c0_g1_i5.p2 TRINITY_DN1759_c0_g1~~TRINITY_DN1759_c0_g1_i5.p2  ORF type:complete len:195 (-),score=63.73 TRINITY_DN1759_c0_g1_i5:1460-2044(-)
MSTSKPKVIILPGNGAGDVTNCNWYGWLASELEKRGVCREVILRNMPDPVTAREDIWLPFVREQMKPDESTIVVGHSSGAEAAMRLLEGTKLLGCVLVSACHTDLGDSNEAASGYYNRPWKWESIRDNAQWIVQFHSEDDPFIPVSEAQHVAESLQSDYRELQGYSHFFDPFEQLIDTIVQKCEVFSEAHKSSE